MSLECRLYAMGMVPIESNDYHLRKLLDKLTADHGLDFSNFRLAYVSRRVGTRLIATGAASIREYIRLLDSDPSEYPLLVDALTVNVSEFFRDKSVFRYLRNHVIPEILSHKLRRNHEVIRVWSAGCSTGEEPYSLAMLFLEAMEKAGKRFRLAISGTDIDRGVLAFAKAGRYPIAKSHQIPKDVAHKFTINRGDEFEMTPQVRDLVRFRRHDLFADNAIGADDLILCRNVVIYFDRRKQIIVFEKFFDSLRKGGFLVIGKSEKLAPGVMQHLETCSLPERVYRRPL